ncbi:ABC transporter permease [Auritidibacter sp. NML100628]|uniref:ABC transporter permease n=1 Tax=Auritidibacter sp. NML100628 TaxID=2170742 RepID=UPI000D729E28|nr:ABC transporter permease [Auritidibacter sp. NML100628]PXA76151.1 ABC transporter [Auritidibacter sp. NML100628]
MASTNDKEAGHPQTAEFVSAVKDSYPGVDKLTPIGGRPGIGKYIRQLWQRRHFIWRQSRGRVVTGNDDAKLGPLWLVLRPTLDAAFYWIIFGLLLQFDRGMDNFVAFVIIGVFMFQMTGSALGTGSKVIASSRSLIRAFKFPRMALPLGEALYDLLQRGPAFLMMFLIIMAIPPHELPEWSWLLFPIILLIHVVLNFGITLLVARLAVVFPDLSKVIPFLTRLLMYGSGVIFPITRFTTRYPTLEAIIELNPIYTVLLMYREILIDGTVPAVEHWLVLCGWAVVLFVAGFLVFWQGEESYGRERNV